ncbi:hypothetical protein HPB50_016358 [Hyalomma asiaticum]|uniref:Uncharacterized protein n=1 Tax=Hyalomma asiaticum TaxID=266040 RepID=A0ACB7SP31_HYAAI|nr:hypothetical protein HPB50_016358 [Hyalomma asiaticum]
MRTLHIDASPQAALILQLPTASLALPTPTSASYTDYTGSAEAAEKKGRLRLTAVRSRKIAATDGAASLRRACITVNAARQSVGALAAAYAASQPRGPRNYRLGRKQRHNLSFHLHESGKQSAAFRASTGRAVHSLVIGEGSSPPLRQPACFPTRERARIQTAIRCMLRYIIQRYGLDAPLHEVSSSHERSRKDCPARAHPPTLQLIFPPLNGPKRSFHHPSVSLFDERERRRLEADPAESSPPRAHPRDRRELCALAPDLVRASLYDARRNEFARPLNSGVPDCATIGQQAQPEYSYRIAPYRPTQSMERNEN